MSYNVKEIFDIRNTDKDEHKVFVCKRVRHLENRKMQRKRKRKPKIFKCDRESLKVDVIEKLKVRERERGRERRRKQESEKVSVCVPMCV